MSRTPNMYGSLICLKYRRSSSDICEIENHLYDIHNLCM